jgi:hypothetical protein
MKSPFPGMDPYIEQHGLWPDFHHDLIADIKRALVATLPDEYFVRTDERSYVALVEAEGTDRNAFLPDLGVTSSRPAERAAASRRTTVAAGAPAASGPLSLRAFVDEQYRESFIEVYLADSDEQLVTCIEVLSPANKRRGSEGWDLYQRKRQAMLLGAANLVEIDLLRGGARMPMLDPLPNTPYYLLVCRRLRAPTCSVWPADCGHRLPEIPVPLATPDSDLTLDLQPIIDAIFVRNRYARKIDYSRPLAPPLTPEEAAWLQRRPRGETEAPRPAASPRRPRRRK